MVISFSVSVPVLSEHTTRPTLRAPVPADLGCRSGHPPQRGDGLVGARLLHAAQGGVERHDRPDHDRLV
jgi:hypothetical protein